MPKIKRISPQVLVIDHEYKKGGNNGTYFLQIDIGTILTAIGNYKKHI